MKKINLKIAFKDRRGKIIDLIENEKINAVTLITIKKGAVRGNHYHKKTWQWNYIISGKMSLVTKMPNKKTKIAVDVMGGDYAPSEIIKGILSSNLPIDFTLIGNSKIIEKEWET